MKKQFLVRSRYISKNGKFTLWPTKSISFSFVELHLESISIVLRNQKCLARSLWHNRKFWTSQQILNKNALSETQAGYNLSFSFISWKKSKFPMKRLYFLFLSLSPKWDGYKKVKYSMQEIIMGRRNVSPDEFLFPISDLAEPGENNRIRVTEILEYHKLIT